MKKLLSLVAILVAGSAIAFANPCDGHKACGTPKVDKAALMQKAQPLINDIKLWAKQDVVPTMQEWKNTLDRSMSSQDLASLNQLRSTAALLRQQQKDAMKAMHQARLSENEDAMEQAHTTLETLREKHTELFDNVKPLAEKYKSTLQSIGETAKPKVQSWKETLQTKVKDFLVANNLSSLGRMLHHKAGFLGAHHPRKMAVMFMLWNGDNIVDELEQEFMPPMGAMQTMGMKQATTQPSGVELRQSFPNPANGVVTFQFVLAQAENVKLVLLDVSGREVATIANERYAAGEHSVTYNVRDVSNGTYTYALSTSKGTVSKTLSVAK